LPSQKKRSHDDQDLPENREGETKKRRRKDVAGSLSKKGKSPNDTSNYERFEDADEPRQEQE
ncbi:hypothetical protein Tco_0043675, partial [Tanacetum coccineum]